MPAGCHLLNALHRSQQLLLCDKNLTSTHAIAFYEPLVRITDGWTDRPAT